MMSAFNAKPDHHRPAEALYSLAKPSSTVSGLAVEFPDDLEPTGNLVIQMEYDVIARGISLPLTLWFARANTSAPTASRSAK
jgi:hypothetical protein